MSLIANTILKGLVYQNVRFITSPFGALHLTKARHLYSSASIGIDNYIQTRKRTKEQFTSLSDKFKSKMADFVSDPKSMIFSEDLKNMIHIAEPTDLNLILDMIKKFNGSNTDYRFGSFIFGPVVMRMFYFLDAPNEALKCFEEPVNKGFFDQQISYQILLDMLYIHEMYDEMFSVFEVVKEKQLHMIKYPKYAVVLILAACYKQNTPQSFEYASRLWSDMANVGTRPIRRAATYFAALALKQGAPQIAVESISAQKQNYVTIRNIKAMALADMGRVDDAILVLRNVLNIDIPEEKDKHTFFEETIIRVRQAAEKSNNKDLKRDFDEVENALKDRNLINSQTLDQLVNSEISVQINQNRQDTLNFQNKRMPFGHRRRN